MATNSNQTRGAGQHTDGNYSRSTQASRAAAARRKAAKKRRKIIVFAVEVVILLAMVGVMFLVFDISQSTFGPFLADTLVAWMMRRPNWRLLLL